MTPREEIIADFIGIGLSIDKHPIGLVRHILDTRGVLRATQLAKAHHGERIEVAGMVITRQRPPTAKGMVFLTLEDETGLMNLVITPPVYERLRSLARDEPFLVAGGKVERAGDPGFVVVNLRVEELARLPEVAAPGFPSAELSVSGALQQQQLPLSLILGQRH